MTGSAYVIFYLIRNQAYTVDTVFIYHIYIYCMTSNGVNLLILAKCYLKS